jgi:beta-lactamase class A
MLSIAGVLSLAVACSGPSPDETANPLAPSPTPTSPSATSTPSSIASTSEAQLLIPSPTATERARPTQTATPRSTPTPRNTPTPAPPDYTTERQAIETLLAGRTGLYGIAVSQSGGEPIYSANPDEQFESASLYKLAVMVEVFRQREAGTFSFDDTVLMQSAFFSEDDGGDVLDPSYAGSAIEIGELVELMITLSSNAAGWALLDLVGTENVNATMAGHGMSATEIRWAPLGLAGIAPLALGDDADRHDLAAYASLPSKSRPTVRADNALNVTTAADLARLFQLLLAGELVSPEASAQMLDLLARQTFNDRLPRYLPDGSTAHKTGTLDGLYHDAGVIYSPAGPVIAVVLTEGALEWEAVEFEAELGALLWNIAP